MTEMWRLMLVEVTQSRC